MRCWLKHVSAVPVRAHAESANGRQLDRIRVQFRPRSVRHLVRHHGGGWHCAGTAYIDRPYDLRHTRGGNASRDLNQRGGCHRWGRSPAHRLGVAARAPQSGKDGRGCGDALLSELSCRPARCRTLSAPAVRRSRTTPPRMPIVRVALPWRDHNMRR